MATAVKRGKVCRRLEMDLDLFSPQRALSSKCKENVPPGGGSKKRSGSDFRGQLITKQQMKQLYGVNNEKQFRRYYREAARRKGATGINLINILESRLDNVVYRAGFGITRAEARQLVSHKAILVNGSLVNIPSMLLREGDVVSIAESSKKQTRIQDALQIRMDRGISDWISVDSEKLEAKFTRLPEREEVIPDINENLVVELYSK